MQFYSILYIKNLKMPAYNSHSISIGKDKKHIYLLNQHSFALEANQLNLPFHCTR